MKAEKVRVACPKCGHTQQEPASAYSSKCKKCGEYFRLEDVLRAASPRARTATPEAPARALRHVRCFQCGTDLEVSASAQSTMCKRCSSHMDLRDYTIANAVSKNFRTRGRFVVEESGYVFNTEAQVAEAVLKGRFLGKLEADTLEIHRTAQIKGSFKAGKLILPADCNFHWVETLVLGGADIAGELVANIKATGVITIRASARFFGNIEATGLAVESGAVLVGDMKIRPASRKAQA